MQRRALRIIGAPMKKIGELINTQRAFMRGFGAAIADIWRLHHDGQMVRHLIKANGFSLASFRDVEMLEADYAAICQALR